MILCELIYYTFLTQQTLTAQRFNLLASNHEDYNLYNVDKKPLQGLC
jgi:hypothetical protein